MNSEYFVRFFNKGLERARNLTTEELIERIDSLEETIMQAKATKAGFELALHERLKNKS